MSKRSPGFSKLATRSATRSSARRSIEPSVIGLIDDITEHLITIQREYISFDSQFKTNKTHNNLIISLHKILTLINSILKMIVKVHNAIKRTVGGQRSLKKELAKYIETNRENRRLQLQKETPELYILLNFEFMVSIIYMILSSYKTKHFVISLIAKQNFPFILAVLHITKHTNPAKINEVFFANYVEYVNSNDMLNTENPEIKELMQEGRLAHLSSELSKINDEHFFGSLKTRFRNLGVISHY